MTGFKISITIHAPEAEVLLEAVDALAEFFCDYANSAPGFKQAYFESGDVEPSDEEFDDDAP
jgi:hypothetical protein